MRICFTLHFMGKGHEDMRETWRGEAGTTFSEVAGSHQQALTTGYVHLAVLTSPVLYVWFCVESCMARVCAGLAGQSTLVVASRRIVSMKRLMKKGPAGGHLSRQVRTLPDS
jgi:hypothetical protein